MAKVYIDLNPLINDPRSVVKMALTERNDGKTTGSKCAALQSFYDSGKAAIFCRRWGDSELTQDFYDTFTDDIQAAHPEMLINRKIDISGAKKKGYALYVDGAKAISFLPLTRAARSKSNFPYQSYRNIYIDEYIPLDGRYVKAEAEAIMELWRTVDRDHSGALQYENYVLITGNKITYSNPIFRFFNIRTLSNNAFNRFQNGRVIVFPWARKGNPATAAGSLLDDLFAGTAMQGYTQGGFMNDLSAFICPVHTKQLFACIIYQGGYFGIYKADDGVLCVDYLKGNYDGKTPLLCVQAEADTRARFVSIHPARFALRKAKATNRLRFQNEILFENLRGLYTAI